MVDLYFVSVGRMGGELPEGVVSHPNGSLVFGRPLSLSHGGTYQCVAKNDVGEMKVEVAIDVAGKRQQCQHHILTFP